MTSRVTRRHLVTGSAALAALTLSACSGKGDGHSSSSSDGASSPYTTSPKPAASKSTAAQPTTDPLTDGKKTGRPVIAVKLENTAAAMPQYGLSPADLVFVEEVEGSLTRLMPIFQSSYPTRIEPVRSARSTDIELLPMFGHPVLAYSGVASQIQDKLTKAPITLYNNGTRDPGRVAPHNLYFDIDRLAKRKGLATSKDIGLRFAADDPGLRQAPQQKSFAVRVGDDRFSFSYTGTRYQPSWNGRAYTDAAANGRHVETDNVLVLKVRKVSDGYLDPAGNPVYRSESTGSGALTLYRNGRMLSGTWQRAAPNQPFRLHDQHGKPLLLTPGKSWILLQS